MSERELLKELKKRMLKYGYCDTWMHLKVLINEYEDLTKNEKPIKLKQVIKRIKKLDDNLKFDWTYKLLQELGSDFGSKMFHEAYQQGRFDEALETHHEPEKVTIPQFVAEWYEGNKTNLEYNIWEYIYNWDKQNVSQIKTWFDYSSNKPLQTLINMKQFGYEVEKEKRYKVVMLNIASSGGVLTRIKHNDSWIWIDTLGTIVEGRTHTRKELEDAGFGWVFDCEGIEIEEVE